MEDFGVAGIGVFGAGANNCVDFDGGKSRIVPILGKVPTAR
jgi:hypothetical protein